MNVEVTPIMCKYCGKNNVVRFGTYKGNQRWWCHDCKRKFTPKDTLPRMRYTNDQIATALRLYYEGLSLEKIREEFRHLYGKGIATSSLYAWVQEFTNEAIKRARDFKPKIGDEWMADETAVLVRGRPQKGKKNDRFYWLFDVIDTKTRFLLATHISTTRSIGDVQAVMDQAAKAAGKVPDRILTDKMKSYPDGIAITFNGKVKHIQSNPFEGTDDTNIVERINGTIKDRLKILRGFKSVDTAKQILDGWAIYYNFFRPHESLGGKSPAEHMKVKMPFTSWLDIVKNTKERVINPEKQPTVIPLLSRFKDEPELRRQYHRNWYGKHHTRKYKTKKSSTSPSVGLSGMR